MGYASSGLAKGLARKGVEVHVLATKLPPYYFLPDFQETYGAFTDNAGDHASLEEIDGYKVHYMPHEKRLGHLRMRGLFSKLRSLRPHIVQTFVTVSWMPLEAALASPLLGFKLFKQTA